ncbi:MAG TPA: Na+/H+ antiporter NhaA [Pirellulaceae bacterium]|nr:Na+/H+ antiporter NhaA [Pirellulaceae bacterium]HMO92672.1 Na+/H+ antiporter NhaA [Pirellulaceae bacterium]HMP70580.1 Na+/H+ antiporter NhaA [Pirellulaceae bacterium]
MPFKAFEPKPTPVEVLLSPVFGFVKQKSSAGIVLLLCTFAALVWANSPWSEYYFKILNTKLNVGIDDLISINKPILLWINDGLMAVFFFVVGLEIKREVLVGELTSVTKAALPVAAAIGGMLGPAAIYVLLNYGRPEVVGWGVPMATDIAFAVGVLAILGSRVPLGLRIFLTALAIVDDIGAVLVIAIFYTDQISFSALTIAHLLLVCSVVANLLGVRSTTVYAVIGIAMWVAMLKSGVHATIAGVLLAMTIPANVRLHTLQFSAMLRTLVNKFDEAETIENKISQNKIQQELLHKIEVASGHVQAPLIHLEHMLIKWVAYFIMPVFALANAGVTINGGIANSLVEPACYGIAAGLFVGKLFGIVFFSWLAVRVGIAQLPAQVTWKQVWGAACLAGIGFTMSLFIAGLAFNDEETLNVAKVGILLGSLVSGVVGFTLLYTHKYPAKVE